MPSSEKHPNTALELKFEFNPLVCWISTDSQRGIPCPACYMNHCKAFGKPLDQNIPPWSNSPERLPECKERFNRLFIILGLEGVKLD